MVWLRGGDSYFGTMHIGNSNIALCGMYRVVWQVEAQPLPQADFCPTCLAEAGRQGILLKGMPDERESDARSRP